MALEMREMKPEERKLSYTQDDEAIKRTGCIGHLRGYFEKGGEILYTTWDDHSKELLTDKFKSEINEVVTALRRDKQFGNVLKDHRSMEKYMYSHPNSRFEGGGRDFGVRADTADHTYMIRCNPDPGEYSVYIYAYNRQMLEKAFEKPEVYRQTASYAREHGEIEMWRESKAANIACRDAIDKAVAENYDGAHLKTDKILDAVVSDFGRERVELVLAATIQEKINDGRFSNANKEWAKNVTMIDGDKCYMVSDRTHSVLLDALAKAFRENYLEKKPSVIEQLKASQAKFQPKICRKSEPER